MGVYGIFFYGRRNDFAAEVNPGIVCFEQFDELFASEYDRRPLAFGKQRLVEHRAAPLGPNLVECG